MTTNEGIVHTESEEKEKPAIQLTVKCKIEKVRLAAPALSAYPVSPHASFFSVRGADELHSAGVGSSREQEGLIEAGAVRLLDVGDLPERAQRAE
jgi:hypothetical protein